MGREGKENWRSWRRCLAKHALHRNRQRRRQCSEDRPGRIRDATRRDQRLPPHFCAIPFFSSTLISHSVPLSFMLADNCPSPSVHVAASSFGSFFRCPFKK